MIRFYVSRLLYAIAATFYGTGLLMLIFAEKNASVGIFGLLVASAFILFAEGVRE